MNAWFRSSALVVFTDRSVAPASACCRECGCFTVCCTAAAAAVRLMCSPRLIASGFWRVFHIRERFGTGSLLYQTPPWLSLDSNTRGAKAVRIGAFFSPSGINVVWQWCVRRTWYHGLGICPGNRNMNHPFYVVKCHIFFVEYKSLRLSHS